MNLLRENESTVVFIVDKNDITFEEFLFTKNISGRLYRKLKRENGLFLNSNSIRKNVEVRKGDIISLVMKDEENNIAPEKIPLNIIYEDYDLLVLNKQPNVVVHPTRSHLEKTLSNGISYYYKQNNIKKKIRFINRLDMNTTGVIMVAKNPFSHHQMSLQFQENRVEKKYLAVVKGIVEKNKDIIDLPIGREEEKSIKKVVTQNGQESTTVYKVLKRFDTATLLEVQIFTGRSHQIRVHLEHIGHPIIGDTLYGEASSLIERQALHAYYLKVQHPRNNRDLIFEAELPEDMKNLLKKLDPNMS